MFIVQNHISMKTKACIAFIILLALSFMSPVKSSGITDDKPDNTKPPVQKWFPVAPALPRASVPTVLVSKVGDLIRAINQAVAGQTILIEDGHYMMPRYVEISADNCSFPHATLNLAWKALFNSM